MKFKAPMLAAVLSVSMTGAAMAQGMWTGFYVGANVGAAFGNSDVTTAPLNDTYFDTDNLAPVAAAGMGSINTTGFAGGGQGGYNWQSGNLVFGGEVAFGAMDLSGSRSTTAPYAAACGCGNFNINESVSTDWLLTVRPRVGLAFGPSGEWLVGVNGGLALTDLQSSSQFADQLGFVESASDNEIKPGWTIGASLGYALNDNWSAELEYSYVDFGNVSYTGTGNEDGQTFSHSADLTANIVSLAVNYKF